MSPFHGPLTQVARIFKSSTNKDGQPLVPSNRALLIVCAIVALVFATMWLLYLRFGYRVIVWVYESGSTPLLPGKRNGSEGKYTCALSGGCTYAQPQGDSYCNQRGRHAPSTLYERGIRN
jgi:hypothetical protein